MYGTLFYYVAGMIIVNVFLSNNFSVSLVISFITDLSESGIVSKCKSKSICQLLCHAFCFFSIEFIVDQKTNLYCALIFHEDISVLQYISVCLYLVIIVFYVCLIWSYNCISEGHRVPAAIRLI